MMDGSWYEEAGDASVNMAMIRAAIARLALLGPLEYAVERKAEAKRLGLPVATLDAEVAKARPKQAADEAEGEIVETLETWPDPVDGASLAEEIRSRLRVHVVFASAADADAATLWVFGSYLMDTWRLWPRLMITSPTKQCGKSTLLEVLDALAHRGLIVSNTKSAGVFRAIEAWRPTLLFDEADTWMKEDVELAGILNSGHTRRTARVIRVQEKNGELIPTLFSTWAPMVIAGIGSQRDTLTSRSVVIGLRRKLGSEAVERLPHDLHARMLRVRRQLARWAADNAIRLGAMECEPPECGNDRRRDNFTPLWRIAQALGGPWPERIASAYAVQAAAEDEADEPAGVMLLRDLAGMFEERRTDRLQSSDVVVYLVNLEERPWSEWKHGRPLTAQSVAKLLRPFDVRPRNWKTGGQVLKSYFRQDVEAAVKRYAPRPPQDGSDDPLHRYRLDTKQKKAGAERYRNGEGSESNQSFHEQKPAGSGEAGAREAWEDFDGANDPNNPEAWA